MGKKQPKPALGRGAPAPGVWAHVRVRKTFGRGGESNIQTVWAGKEPKGKRKVKNWERGHFPRVHPLKRKRTRSNGNLSLLVCEKGGGSNASSNSGKVVKRRIRETSRKEKKED